MRNIFLIAKREYLERVRSKSFLIMTIMVPVLMAALTIGPGLLAVRLSKRGPQHFVVVASNRSVAEAIKEQLSKSQEETSKQAAEAKQKSLRRSGSAPPSQVVTDIDTNTSAEERAALTDKVRKKEIDGVIWATDDALAAKKLPYPQVTLAASIVMVMILYISLILYGVNVMRSVLEEKTSRIMEVMLSVAQPKEMMAGKILGVGSVGLTQFAIWGATASVLTGAQVFAAGAQVKGFLSATVLIAFAVFFLLGYSLYSTMYAAVGAMVNSEQEGQQTQFLVVMPLIAAVVLLFPVLENPNSPLAFWGSMVPFTSPILMFVRIAVQPPPWWQIVLSIAINAATVYGLVLLCARIYRVGVLMYGKKPTLPEILKWLKYA